MMLGMKKFLLFLWLIFGVSVCFGAVDYSAIDSFAENAPPLKTNTGLPKLVNYLVKSYKSDVAKARVLLAWIVYNIDYDSARLKRITDGKEPQDIEISLNVEEDPRTGELVLRHGDLKILHTEDTIQRTLQTRKGICKDIARLYHHMCQLAGLETEIVNGYACEQTQEIQTSEAHMWNAIKINGMWYFVDPTFALRGRIIYVNDQSEAKMVERQLRQGRDVDKMKGVKKVVDNKWFLIDKEKIIQTHFPFERRWQLQKKRVTFENFLKKSCHTTLKHFVDEL